MSETQLSKQQLALIQEWQRSKNTLELAKSCESQLREKVVAAFVPEVKEGATTVKFAGVTVKVTGKVNRTLDEAALEAVMPQLPERYRVVGHEGSLISYSAKFSLDVYRKMSDEERKIFEQALTIKDGATALEVIIAK
jgi:hypothetical protein